LPLLKFQPSYIDVVSALKGMKYKEMRLDCWTLKAETRLYTPTYAHNFFKSHVTHKHKHNRTYIFQLKSPSSGKGQILIRQFYMYKVKNIKW